MELVEGYNEFGRDTQNFLIFTVRRVGEPRERRGFHGDKVDKCGNADWNRALKTSDQSSVSKGCIFAYSHKPIFFSI